MIQLAPFSTRNQFGPFLNSLELCNIAVEIGTHRGEFANILLSRWHGKILCCVDPWSVPKGYEEQAQHLTAIGGKGDRTKDRIICEHILERHRDRVRYYQKTSKEAVKSFLDHTLDFVYIDGDHREEMVFEDLNNWWQKVKPGGIIAGHDWLCPGEVDGGWGRGIQSAVETFFRPFRKDIFVIAEECGLPWSFYVMK